MTIVAKLIGQTQSLDLVPTDAIASQKLATDRVERPQPDPDLTTLDLPGLPAPDFSALGLVVAPSASTTPLAAQPSVGTNLAGELSSDQLVKQSPQIDDSEIATSDDDAGHASGRELSYSAVPAEASFSHNLNRYDSEQSWTQLSAVQPVEAAVGVEIPSGYVELSNGVYVPESFMRADAEFRQAREARYQAWAVYQQAMNQQSAMVAALLPSQMWQPETGYPYADSVAIRNVTYRGSGMINLPTARDSFPLYPLPSAVEMTSPYGWRIHPITGERKFHEGVDLSAPTGTPVLASLSGVVESAGPLGGYGYAIVIRHLNGSLQTLYGHLSALYVEPGEAVKQGQMIGAVGSTGNSTGSHLHFEMQQYGATGWASIDNTSLVTFAQSLLQYQQSGRYMQPVTTVNAMAGYPTPIGVNPYAASLFDPSLYSQQQQQQQQQQQTAQGVEIRVGVELDVDSFTVGGSTSLAITASNGVQRSVLPAGQAYRVTRSGAGVTVGGQSYSGAVFVQATGSNGLTAINGRYYRGRVLLGARPQGGVSAINWVNIEQYLWGVVGHEVYPSWHSDALKAQAVAARSYAMYYRYHPVSRDWYDIGDDTYYQAYGGTVKEFATTTAAVNATAGQVLMQGGSVLQAMYAATEELSREAHGGIGMAQWGAADKADAGWGYTSILAHYYHGASLGVVQ